MNRNDHQSQQLSSEERIAPGLHVNRSETVVAQASHDECELDIEVLEERIAPGLHINRSENVVVSELG